MVKTIETPIILEDDDNFKTALSKFGCIAFDRQANLGDLIGEAEGDLDLENGILTFPNDISFDVQVLGYYSEDLSQWSWAWDNESVGFDEKLIEDACKIRDIAEKHKWDQFLVPVFKTDYNYCHTWAMIATTILGWDAYYSYEVDGLNIFLLIKSDLIKENNSPLKFRDTYIAFCKNFDVDHKLVFEAYTKLKGYSFKDGGEFHVAKIDEARIITGFTERGNLTHVQLLDPQ